MADSWADRFVRWLYRGRAWQALVAALLVACAALGTWAWSMYRTGSDWPTVEGRVVEVRESGSGPSWDKKHSTTISYVVDGIEYEFKSDHGDSTTRVGDPVTVFYDPGNPARTTTDEDRYIRGVGVGFGALICLALAGLFGYLPAYRRLKRR